MLIMDRMRTQPLSMLPNRSAKMGLRAIAAAFAKNGPDSPCSGPDRR
jgi:hypothetical protein